MLQSKLLVLIKLLTSHELYFIYFWWQKPGDDSNLLGAVSTGGRSFLLLSDSLIQPRGQIHKYWTTVNTPHCKASLFLHHNVHLHTCAAIIPVNIPLTLLLIWLYFYIFISVSTILFIRLLCCLLYVCILLLTVHKVSLILILKWSY